ncbi:MAG TPA: cytochrome c [Stellaceae bacterium]|nr:cytochrome c [Stellaceae bacterium]
MMGRPRLPWWLVSIVAAALFGDVAALVAWTLQDRPPLFANAEDRGAVARGAAIYAERCASCHGRSLGGQKDWQTVDANGRLPAPPPDQRGHTWMHSDEELARIVKFSVRDTAAPGYVSDMPAFEGVLGDAEVLAVLAYIKSRWPIGVRVYQAALNPKALGMPAGAVGPDWKLPEDCGWEPIRIAKPRE